MIPSLTETPSRALFIMPKGRRRLAVIALGVTVCAGASLAIWGRMREEMPSVKLFHLGFTNEIRGSLPLQEVGSYRDETFVIFRKAVIGITNTSNKSVLPASRFQVKQQLGPGQYVDAKLSALAPGEMITTTVLIPNTGADWEAELAYFQYGLMEQWISRAKASTRSPLKAIAAILPIQKVQWAEGIWITNRPARKRFHIEAPLPPFIFEPPLKDTNTLAN